MIRVRPQRCLGQETRRGPGPTWWTPGCGDRHFPSSLSQALGTSAASVVLCPGHFSCQLAHTQAHTCARTHTHAHARTQASVSFLTQQTLSQRLKPSNDRIWELQLPTIRPLSRSDPDRRQKGPWATKGRRSHPPIPVVPGTSRGHFLVFASQNKPGEMVLTVSVPFSRRA